MSLGKQRSELIELVDDLCDDVNRHIPEANQSTVTIAQIISTVASVLAALLLVLTLVAGPGMYSALGISTLILSLHAVLFLRAESR